MGFFYSQKVLYPYLYLKKNDNEKNIFTVDATITHVFNFCTK